MVQIKALFFCVLVATLLPVQSVLASEEALTVKVQQCSQITQDQDRLSCFDQLVTKKTRVATVLPKPDLTAQQLDNFAKEHVEKSAEEKANEITSITLTISKLNKSPYGKWNINFSNGQKWKQKDSARLRLKEGDIVVLTKGILGSFFLQKENTTKRIKVKRLK